MNTKYKNTNCLCPITVVIFGFGDKQRVQARYGNWRGKKWLVKGNFQKAHEVAMNEAKIMLKK